MHSTLPEAKSEGEAGEPSLPFSFPAPRVFDLQGKLWKSAMFPDLFRDDVFTLETPRLFLRWPKASDAPAIALQAGDRKVAEMTANIPHPYPSEVSASRNKIVARPPRERPAPGGSTQVDTSF